MVTGERATTEFSDSLTLRRFSTGDYLRMVELGVLGPEDRVELIGGMVVEMSPAGSRHNHFLGRLNRLFARILDRGEVWVQGTLLVAESDVFDPDFLLLRLKHGGYKQQLPTPADVLLLVEAADSSLRRDQQVKLPVYADVGIRDYWIADLEREVILVHRQPEGKTYHEVTTFRGDELLSPLAVPDFCFAVREAFD